MNIAQSQAIVESVVQFIIEQAKRKEYFDRLIRNNLTQYCSSQSLKYYHETYNQHNRKPQPKQQCKLQKQPNALKQDNFFPTDITIDSPTRKVSQRKTSIDKKQLKLQRNITNKSISQVQPAKKTPKVQQPSPYQKLDLPEPEQEEPILKQLRKQILQDQNKKQTPVIKIKQQKGKKKQGGKEQKVGFDYNGQIVRLKQQSRNHLVSNGLNGQTLKTSQKLKQVKKNLEVTQVQYERKEKRILKIGKNNDVEFTQIRSLLSQARAAKGAKFTQGTSVLEQKRKVLPVNELMKTLTERRLSKVQYRRIKQSTGSVAQFDEYNSRTKTNSIINTLVTETKVQPQDNASLLRSASQSKLSNALSRRRSTITVSDPNLLDVLISGAENQSSRKQKTIKNAEQKEQITLGKFDSNDYYNLQYIKKGGSLNPIKKSKSVASLQDGVLPKIQTHRQQMPRVRERLKDKQQIVRQIRRRFQQKLRT